MRTYPTGLVDSSQDTETALLSTAEEAYGVKISEFKKVSLNNLVLVDGSGNALIPYLIKKWEGQLPETYNGKKLVWQDTTADPRRTDFVVTSVITRALGKSR